MAHPFSCRRLLLAALSLWGALQVAAPATGQCTPELLGTLDGVSANEIVVVGNVAYLAGPGLVLVDVTDPTTPAVLGSYDTPDEGRGVAVVGDVAYLTTGNGGLYTIDVSDPTAPVFLDRDQQAHYFNRVAVAGDVAYVAALESGLRLIDVSDPTDLVRLGSVGISGSAHDVVVSGDVAYVAGSWGGFKTFDVSDPNDPFLLDSRNTFTYAYEVALSGNLAYVACRSTIEVMDISDPTNLVKIRKYPLPGPCYWMTVSGDLAYITSRNHGLLLIDLSDPVRPDWAGVYPTASFFYGTAVADGVAYVYEYGGKLRILDVSTALGEAYCDPAEVGPAYSQGWLGVQGSRVAADDDLMLTAIGVPGPDDEWPAHIGYFLMGTGTNTFVPPGSAGPICISPGLQRLLPGVSNSGELGHGFRRCVGTRFFPEAPILAGETWNFQAWFRVPSNSSNLTNAMSITFQ